MRTPPARRLSALGSLGSIFRAELPAEGLFELGKRQVFYVHEGDSALGLSSWLFSSGTRLGRLRPDTLKAAGRQFLNSFPRVEFIDTRIKTPDNFTHSYFYAHPAVQERLAEAVRAGGVRSMLARDTLMRRLGSCYPHGTTMRGD